jgi:hypothetical protein
VGVVMRLRAVRGIGTIIPTTDAITRVLTGGFTVVVAAAAVVVAVFAVVIAVVVVVL